LDQDRAKLKPWKQILLRSVLDGNHGATLVLAALLADAVGELLFATVRAVGDAHGRQEVVATAFCGALLRVPALWIRHGKPSSSWASQLEAVRPKSLETQSSQTLKARSQQQKLSLLSLCAQQQSRPTLLTVDPPASLHTHSLRGCD